MHVKTFHAIFISPSVKEDYFNEWEDGLLPKKQKISQHRSQTGTRSSISNLFHLNGKVTGHAIAYAAVIVSNICNSNAFSDLPLLKFTFNLTDAIIWAETYNSFSFHGFYNFIVDYFEDIKDATSQAHVSSLLTWWNQ